MGYAHFAFLLFVAASLTTAPAFCGGRRCPGFGCSTVGISRVLWPFTFFRRLPLLSRKTILIRRWDLLAFIVPLQPCHPELREKVIVPDVLIQAHSASLGMAFYDGKMFQIGRASCRERV